jgi:cytochrome P450
LIRQKQGKIEITGHKTIFSELLDSDLPPEELSVKRLGEEANIILGAATETIKGALTVATFHLLNNPTLHKKLREELLSAIPEKDTILPLPDLEKLPYLTACIQEGIL